MDLQLRLKQHAPALNHFTAEQLIDLARSFTVKLDPGVELVYFGQTAPFDTSKRWQPTDAYGAPVGQMKTFNGTSWT
jgi:hypothetical protein